MEENVNQTEKEMAENEKQKQAEKAVGETVCLSPLKNKEACIRWNSMTDKTESDGKRSGRKRKTESDGKRSGRKCKLGTDRNDPGTDRTAGGGAERKGTLEQKSRVGDEDDERDRKIKRIYIF